MQKMANFSINWKPSEKKDEYKYKETVSENQEGLVFKKLNKNIMTEFPENLYSFSPSKFSKKPLTTCLFSTE